ncbi:hypothetical protein SY88_03380 [Clostridiales bacterium PH28_bin88]|nr:hypothetical protein SY88_03380 [Clostridiales bacterium PH28_bin88]
MKYLIDSDVIIWYLRGRRKTVELIDHLLEDGILACSALSIFEVMRGARPEEMEDTEGFLKTLEMFAITEEVPYLAAALAKRYSMALVDAHIAASCILNDVVLVTYNLKHYKLNDIRVFDTEGW